MVSMAMLFEGEVLITQHQSFSPAPASASGLRSTMPIRVATIGRLFRTRTTTATRGASTSVRAARTRTAAAAAASGILFVLSKGSPNSEHKRVHSIL